MPSLLESGAIVSILAIFCEANVTSPEDHEKNIKINSQKPIKRNITVLNDPGSFILGAISARSRRGQLQPILSQYLIAIRGKIKTMIKKVLLADAGTQNPKEMFLGLRELPAMKDVAVSILNVVPPQVSKEAMTERLDNADVLLAQTVKDLHLEPHQVETLKRQGDPKAVVCEVAEEIDADLIIMGSRGLKRLESILENSVSQYVFQLANRPMLLIRDDAYVKRLKRIMVALDRSESSKYSLDLAMFLARGADVELILTRVNSDLDPNMSLTRADVEANPVIATALAQVKRMGIKHRCVLTGGRPGQQLCKLADEYNADLLVLGSPDRRPSIARALPDLDRLLGTSLSDYVRVNAECPVLLARRSEDS